MTYAEFKLASAELNAEVDRLSAPLHNQPKGIYGLTPDHIKFSPEYRAATRAFDAAFQRLRAFNGTYAKQFKNEIRADINAKRARKIAQRISPN